MDKKIAIYGGTFDPPTLGHLDIIRRAAGLFDKLYVVILINHTKTRVFSEGERITMLQAVTSDIGNVVVDQFDGLLAGYAHKVNAAYSVRGLRNGFDTEYERPMFEFNAQIAAEQFGHKLDTIFIPTALSNFDTSSTNVRMLLSSEAYKIAEKYIDKRISKQVIEKYKYNKNR